MLAGRNAMMLPLPLQADWLMVGAGGGAGGANPGTYGAGGSGAGGEALAGSGTLSLGAYTVTIGAGGVGGTDSFSTPTQGSDGTATTFAADGRTAHGGSGGGAVIASAAANGRGGTLGGGGSGAPGSGGVGTLHSGGAGLDDAGVRSAAGGGAGAGGNGANAAAGSPITAGAGGVGVNSSITGSTVMYGMGAPGMHQDNGGADGGPNYPDGTTRFTVPGNRGCGGVRTSSNANAGDGGLLLIRYYGAARATGGTITSVGGYTLHTFTSSGTFTVTS